MNRYTVGQQPCQDFKPRLDGNAYATWENVHECVFCKPTQLGSNESRALVSFCETCYKDHHVNGYETCDRIGLEKEPRCIHGVVATERCMECWPEEIELPDGRP